MPSGCPASGARVFLKASGEVLLNGKLLTASQLKDALSTLSPRPTIICYSRDSAQGEPPASMGIVLDSIMALRLPVGLFTDATFATPVRGD
jgi:hypothetical protein